MYINDKELKSYDRDDNEDVIRTELNMRMIKSYEYIDDTQQLRAFKTNQLWDYFITISY